MGDDLEKAHKRIKDVVEKGWKDDVPESENAEALLSEATVSVYNEVHNQPRFSDEERKALETSLDEVKHGVIPRLDKEHASVQYINQVGGASNYVKYLMLHQTAEKADSPEFMNALLHKATMMFFHVSGWEQFTDPQIWEQQKRFKQYKQGD